MKLTKDKCSIMYRFVIYAKEGGKWRMRKSAPSQHIVNLESELMDLKNKIICHPNQFKVIIETIRYINTPYGKEVIEVIKIK